MTLCAKRKLTVRKEKVLITLLLITRTDKEQSVFCLLFLHLTCAAVVVLQKHAIQWICWRVTHCLDCVVILILPPEGPHQTYNT